MKDNGGGLGGLRVQRVVSRDYSVEASLHSGGPRQEIRHEVCFRDNTTAIWQIT